MSERSLWISSVPASDWAIPRRRLLKRLAGGVGAAAALRAAPTLAATETAPEGGAGSEAFWQVVKQQFPLRDGLVLMNAANLCPSSYPVLETVMRLTRDVDADASFQNRAKFAELHEASRRGLAALLGAGPEEIAITRNTSESNNMVINGLTLGAGDEVVLWDQNHPTNGVAWDVRARRYGFTVRRVTTPASPRHAAELVEPFRDALTNETKVLAFSHVSNVSGVALPAKALCRLARERGILTHIDGAQTFGALRVDLHTLGCDFYTGSAHKWLMGPKEAGVLYVRGERIDGLWPSIVGVGWDDSRRRDARKFETLGQRDDAAVAAVGKAVAFQQTIGPARIEARIRALAVALKRGLGEIPGVKLFTPTASALSAGVVVATLSNVGARAAFEYLYREHDIAGAGMSGAFAGVRFCPHVYNTMDQVERVVAAIADLTRNGLG